MERTLTAHEVADVTVSSTEDTNLAHSMGDAACFGGMVGCGETYFPAFALAIGLGETAAGLVASVPLMMGGALQLISPWAIRWLGGFQRWIVTGALLQALAFVPLAVAAWSGSLSLTMLLLIASIYWAAGLSTGPAWNTWIEAVVPAERRVRFFSRRSRLQQSTTFMSLMVAGMLLQWSSEQGFTAAGFATLFCVAGFFRLASATFLYLTETSGDAPTSKAPIAKAPIANATTRATALVPPTTERVSGSAKRLLVYLVLMQAFIQFSGPFFVPYMLEQLQFGYGTYVMLISLAFVSKVLSMSFWGRVAERSGAARVLWLGGIGLVPLAALWIISDDILWLAIIQVLSGIAWAAYELGFFLMFFEALPSAQRTRLLTYYNFANGLAMCAGALCGAALLATIGLHAETYYYLFAISSLGRLMCLGVLAGIRLPTHSLKTIRMRVLSVRPGAGSIVAPVVASAEEEGPDPLLHAYREPTHEHSHG